MPYHLFLQQHYYCTS